VRKTAIFILILLFFIPAIIYPTDNGKNRFNELFYTGNQFYKQGKFEDALKTYMEIAETGYKSGNLFFNMDNTFYRMNMTGHSILYYEKALLLMPRNSDLEYNLRFLRSQTKDAVELPSSVISEALFWIKSVSMDELSWIFAVINIFFWGILAIRLYIKKEWTYYLPFIFLTIWLISGVSWVWKNYSVKSDSRAVILTEEINIFSGPDEREKILFQLHAGTIVIQERNEDNWKLIRLDDRNASGNERRGWVKKNDIERINPEV
jgi:hypothetical protein